MTHGADFRRRRRMHTQRKKEEKDAHTGKGHIRTQENGAICKPRTEASEEAKPKAP